MKNDYRKSKRKDTGKGYIPGSVRGSRLLFDYLWRLTENLDFGETDDLDIRWHYHRLLVHIYHSMLSQLSKKDEFMQDKGFIPIKGYLIDAYFTRGVNYKILEDAGLITIKNHDDRRKLSRRYKLTDSIWEVARKLENDFTREAWKSLVGNGDFEKYISVNLRDGEVLRAICGHTFERRNARFKTPQIVKDSIRAISNCVFYPKVAGGLVNALESAVKKSSEELEEYRLKHQNEHGIITSNVIKKEDLHDSLKQKYENLRRSQATILGQQPQLLEEKTRTKGNLYSYKAAYEPQISGRLTEKHGGLQNASRVFKYYCFEYVKNSYNYDLKAAQANILCQELKNCGINYSWLENYLNDGNAKTTYAKRIGVDSNTWKKCLYSTIMGAETGEESGAVYLAILDYFDYDREATITAHQKFLDEAEGLISCCEEWRKAIYDTNHYKYNGKRGYWFWENAVNMKHKKYGWGRRNKLVLMESVYNNQKNPEKNEIKIVTNEKTIEKLRRSLAAFILQGQESCYIHHLTLLCSKHDPEIKVYRNEHDGIITDKKIPQFLIDEAGVKSGLLNPVLKIKPLASENDIETMRKLARRPKPSRKGGS